MPGFDAVEAELVKVHDFGLRHSRSIQNLKSVPDSLSRSFSVGSTYAMNNHEKESYEEARSH